MNVYVVIRSDVRQFSSDTSVVCVYKSFASAKSFLTRLYHEYKSDPIYMNVYRRKNVLYVTNSPSLNVIYSIQTCECL